jgi:hypothetical protein
MNYNCERCGDRLGWREHQGPTLCERCCLRAEVERLIERSNVLQASNVKVCDELNRVNDCVAAALANLNNENVGNAKKWLEEALQRQVQEKETWADEYEAEERARWREDPEKQQDAAELRKEEEV